MTSVCVCKYPLHIIDKRDIDEPIEYLAIPSVTIDEMGEIPIPKIEFVKRPDLNGHMGNYVKASWFDPPKSALTKEYEIIPHNGHDADSHIIVAGCDTPTTSKCKLKDRSKCQAKCVDKTAYAAFHPEDEWRKHHVVVL